MTHKRTLTPHRLGQALLDVTDLLHPGVFDDDCPCLEQVLAHRVLPLMPHLKGTVIPLYLVIQVDATQLWEEDVSREDITTLRRCGVQEGHT